jgi:hypothetical protein
VAGGGQRLLAGPGAPDRPRRWRPASWEPRRIDWLAALIQLAGTVFFNISTFAALKQGLDARQTNLRVWTPDAAGSVCFLVASALAYADVLRALGVLARALAALIDHRDQPPRLHLLRPGGHRGAGRALLPAAGGGAARQRRDRAGRHLLLRRGAVAAARGAPGGEGGVACGGS